MTAVLDYYRAIMLRDAGRRKGYGSIGFPVASVTLAGTNDSTPEITVPAQSTIPVTADAVKLWSYDGHNDWDFFECRIRNAVGFLHCWTLWDTPVSTTDLTRSGSNPRAHYFPLTCALPVAILSRQTLIHPTLATDLGVTAGLPSVLTTPLSGMLTGYIYDVVAFNPGTDDLRVELFWAK